MEDKILNVISNVMHKDITVILNSLDESNFIDFLCSFFNKNKENVVNVNDIDNSTIPRPIVMASTQKCGESI